MKYKKLILALGFTAKENSSGVFQKKYSNADQYAIEIDFENENFLFGDQIKADNKTTQNFSQAENWVVLECVDRLLKKGYQPRNITLEKTWATGHGTSGRLDILVTRDDGSAYLMIECKTWGAEFDKEFKNLGKNGGQLFTYFQQDKNADVIMLYASELDGNEVKFRNEIVKIEEDYRQTGNVKDLYERWNKLPKSNGVFDNWATAYEFQSKALTKKDLKVLKQEDSSFIFNRFLEILRHNVVSDKPNAFNKIFTLFLCKIVDENRGDDDQLHFQWLEGEDNHVSFQKRLTDLYRRGMKELLEKKVSDVSDNEFDTRFQQVEERYRDEIKDILTEIRLKKNNEFAIKEVFDDASFEENAKVVKEVVELLQVYQIRYNYRQQFLSDFFELLLTTGLKQESGQFFTPVPIARFIIKSLPLREMTAKKIAEGNKNDLLPTIIDYAAGSGHFITESMEEVQKYIDELKLEDYKPETRKQIDGFQRVQFDWAEKYVYGIEKDYRLVKTAKVSCYLHGDGLAKVIHGDGLGDFDTSTEFKDLLKETDKTYPQDNKQFDVIISNPPYSVSAFKGLMNEEKAKKAFDLYGRLTDQSSEIECLFIERTKQLLKDGGVAGIILPSSILSNTGIYTQTREIILKYFEVLAITEMGSNTFMATGTNTVTLFLRRRNNADSFNIEEAVKRFFTNLQDVTINGIEKPIEKYLTHVWEGLTIDDYKTLLQKTPNEKIEASEIYQEYKKKLPASPAGKKAKSEEELWDGILALEQDKLLYFILALPQKLVLIKTGEKKEEKRFLGYEFSNRRGSEGIHPIQRSKSIDECTQLYDADTFENYQKASTYIYKAFNNEFDLDLPDSLQKNVSYHHLVDMLTFDRVDFEKNISLSAKKKVKTKWHLVRLGDFTKISSGGTPSKGFSDYWENGNIPWLRSEVCKESNVYSATEFITSKGLEKSSAKYLQPDSTIIALVGATKGRTAFLKFESTTNQNVAGIKSVSSNELLDKYVFEVLKSQYSLITANLSQYDMLNLTMLREFKIPLPPIEIQEKIVSEIEVLEQQEKKAVEEIDDLKAYISNSLQNSQYEKQPLKRYLKGINPSKSETIKNLDLDTPVAFLAMADVSNDAEIINLQTKRLKDVKTGFTFFQKDDVLLAKITPCTENGKGAIIPEIVNNIGFGSTEFYVLRSNPEKIFPRLLFYLTKLKEFRIESEKNMTGTSGHRRVPKSFVENYFVSLAPLQEQQKIVTEIEKIESKIAELENQIAQIPEKKEAVLKKYL